MNRADPLQNRASTFSVDTIVYFTETFNRMFKIGIYYPVGHVVLDQAASKCIQQLREISPSLTSVRIEVERNGLLIEKMELPEASVAVKELHQLLLGLGIKSIEFQRTIPHKQFLFFIKSLLAWRMQLESAQSFISFNVSELPDSIKVEQQEFLVDETLIQNGDSADDYGRNLEEICVSLAAQGLNIQQVEQCRELLEKLSKPQVGEKIDIKGFPNATWHDVETLLYKIITGTYSTDEGRFESVATNDINALTSIFESLEATIADKKTQDTIELLISHLTGSRREQPEKPKKGVRPEKTREQSGQSGQMISVEELNNFIFENNIPLKILEKITSVDRSEEMSILLQMIYPGQNKQLVDDIEEKLKAILVAKLSVREKEVLFAGIKHFADLGDVECFRKLFTMALRSLRLSEYLSSLDFIVELWSKMPYAMHVLLWPFAVNELLVVGMGEKKESFFEVTEIASQMHADGMKRLRFKLEELEACQETKVAPIIFRPSYIYSYRLFAILLETSLGTIIAEKVLSALQEDPQDPLFKAVGPLLDLTVLSHLQFFHSYLNDAHLEEAPLALKMAAGEIVLLFLQNISVEEKSLPWLSKTIASTSELYSKGMEEMLERIVKERKMGVLPTWPRSCRKVAEGCLKAHKRQPFTDLL